MISRRFDVLSSTMLTRKVYWVYRLQPLDRGAQADRVQVVYRGRRTKLGERAWIIVLIASMLRLMRFGDSTRITSPTTLAAICMIVRRITGMDSEHPRLRLFSAMKRLIDTSARLQFGRRKCYHYRARLLRPRQ
jgi:hypothetical protein